MNSNNTSSIIAITVRRIDTLRAQHGLSIRDLASKSGISKSELSYIISQKTIPNIFTLHSICTALEVSLSDFFNQDEQVLMLRGKESILIKIYRELSPMSQDTLIKVSKCMK